MERGNRVLTASEVLNLENGAKLYVGDLGDAIATSQFHPEIMIICVLENKPEQEPSNSTWIPILTAEAGWKADNGQLRTVATVTENALNNGISVLIHCMAGIERAPLATAFTLISMKKFGDYNAAYDHLRSKRPIVQNRVHWLQ